MTENLFNTVSDHKFNPLVAKEYGVIEAVIIHNLKHWVEINITEGRNLHEGRYWSYNSIRGYETIWSYLTGAQIKHAFKKLVDAGVILKGNFSKNSFDKSNWYTFAEPEKFLEKRFIDFVPSIGQISPIDSPLLPNLICNTDINLTDKKHIIADEEIFMPKKAKSGKKSTGTKTLQEWEAEHGRFTDEMIIDWGKEHKLDPAKVRPQIEYFRNNCMAHDRKYANFTAAFKNWFRKPEDLESLRTRVRKADDHKPFTI